MKNKIQIFTLLLIIVTLAACRFDEGPMLSFRKVEDRVQKHFTLMEFTKDGVDMTQELADSCGKEWQFLTKQEASGKLNNLMVCPTDSIFPYQGNYFISDNKKNIKMYITTFSIPAIYIGMEPFKKDIRTTWRIERLAKDEMWLSCTYNNSDYYLKFKE